MILGDSLGMTKGQGEAESLVFVVDDDASIRQALTKADSDHIET